MEANHNSLSPRTPVELPFDILGVVFTYYVETETLFYPLETLLLVSRQWNFAVLGHKALWGRLHIHLGHKTTHNAWKFILPRRLERAGLAPLSIEIRYVLEGAEHPYYERTSACAWEEDASKVFSQCSCIGYAVECAQDLLAILTGPQNEHCKRWTKLHITLGGPHRRRRGNRLQRFKSSLLCDSLSHPMPLLESIYLKDLDVPKSMSQAPFPSTPSVRIVHFEACTFDSLDGVNFSSAESITFRNIDIINKGSNILKLDPPTSIKVIHFDRVDSLSSEIIGSLPHLHTLHLGEYLDDIIAPDSNFPSLKTLSIPVTWAYNHTDSIFFERLTSSTICLLSTLKVLTLSQTRPFWQQPLISLNPFLDKLECVEHITGSGEVLSVILKDVLDVNFRRSCI